MTFREEKKLKPGDTVIFRTNGTPVHIKSIEVDEQYRDVFIHSIDQKTYHHTSCTLQN